MIDFFPHKLSLLVDVWVSRDILFYEFMVMKKHIKRGINLKNWLGWYILHIILKW